MTSRWKTREPPEVSEFIEYKFVYTFNDLNLS